MRIHGCTPLLQWPVRQLPASPAFVGRLQDNSAPRKAPRSYPSTKVIRENEEVTGTSCWTCLEDRAKLPE